MTSSADCPFCRPEIKRSVFAEEDTLFWAIYNVAPILPGHCLVIPRRHLRSVMQLDEDLLYRFFSFARKVTATVLRTFRASGFDWAIQDAEEAGQTVPHLHLHVIPRRPDDMESEGEWHHQLNRNRKEVIDSKDRPRLTLAELDHRVAALRRAFDADWTRPPAHDQ